MLIQTPRGKEFTGNPNHHSGTCTKNMYVLEKGNFPSENSSPLKDSEALSGLFIGPPNHHIKHHRPPQPRAMATFAHLSDSKVFLTHHPPTHTHKLAPINQAFCSVAVFLLRKWQNSSHRVETQRAIMAVGRGAAAQ